MVLTAYITNNNSAFIAKVQNIATQLGINPDWLMVVMFFESSLKPTAYNATTGAVGLLQWLPSTAASLGTNAADLLGMSNVDQLDYVYYYLEPYSGQMNNVYDVYLATFFPAAIGKPDSWVMQTSTLSAQTVAQYNPALDLNGDGVITVGEFKQWIDNQLKEKELYDLIKLTSFSAIGLITLGVTGYLVWKYFKKNNDGKKNN